MRKNEYYLEKTSKIVKKWKNTELKTVAQTGESIYDKPNG